MFKIFSRALLILPLFVLFSSFLEKEKKWTKSSIDPPFLTENSRWADSILNKMTMNEKIGQLFMIGIFSGKDESYAKSMSEFINKYHIGGILYFKGTPSLLVKTTNYLQANAKIPLMIAIDGEWGLSMRLDSMPVFPRQIMLGAIQDEDVIYEMGLEIARQCRRLGVNINFAPVLDINNNPRNPIINSRSFGESRRGVARKGFAYMLGMQDNKVLAVGKHFPGHGDTEIDSHRDLPVIPYNRKRLDSLELFPFKHLINSGIGGIMIGHLFVPALDSSKNLPTSLSDKIVNNLLKNELNYKGLIFTDGLGMQAVTKYFDQGEVEIRAILAGVDILLLPNNVPASIAKIKQAIENKTISMKDIDARCKKILMAKKWMELDKFKPISEKNLQQDLFTSNAELVNRKLIEASITMLENKNDLIPIKKLDTLRIATISVGTGDETQFQKTMNLYTSVKHFAISKNSTFGQFEALRNQLSAYNLVIVSVQNTHHNPSWYGLSQESINFIERIAENKKVILDIFASPYSLAKFRNLKRFESIIISYEDTKLVQDLSAQLIFGGIASKGKLPVSATAEYQVNAGLIDKKNRLKYSIPKEVDVDEILLRKVDTLAMLGISEGAYPGCEILVAKDGVVFYHKAFGYHTYEPIDTVKNTDLYDLASVTKVVATVPSLMRLYEQGLINLNERLAKYIPQLETTDKKNVIIKDILLHQARLSAWIPFSLRTVDRSTNSLRSDIYSETMTDDYSVQVAENIYIKKSYEDSIFKRIYNSPMRKRKSYKYSDLGFYMFFKMVEDLTKIPFENYVQENFYKPLGATTIGYNPLENFPKEQIIPTENDTKIRKQLLQGHVHDYGAAMLGGISGHAGTFSNANDLAKIMQMYVQGGEYGGERFFKEETIKLFTSHPPGSGNNRRGLGFDKPSQTGKSPATRQASMKSFGHTGFTGTMVWADPENQLVFIFLSNRVYPDPENNKINTLSIRHKIQSAVYSALKVPQKMIANK